MASAATTNSTGRDVVGTAIVGEGPQALVDRAQTLRFVFHHVREKMKQERGKFVTPPPLEAFGYLWELHVYPRGCIKYGDSDIDTDVNDDISVF